MTSKDLIKRLGGLLTDLTEDRPPARIHADLMERWTDPQIGEAYRDVKDFVTVWTALRHGLALPEQSWIRLVLPTVAFYSTRDALKANMEMALHMWRSARDAPQEALPAEPTVRLLPPPVPLPPVIEAELVTTPPLAAKRKHWKWWIPLAALACAGALLVFLLTHPSAKARGNAPEGDVPAVDAPIPRTSIALAWDTPVDMGSSGFLHYRIFQNGVDLGQTVYNGKTIA